MADARVQGHGECYVKAYWGQVMMNSLDGSACLGLMELPGWVSLVLERGSSCSIDDGARHDAEAPSMEYHRMSAVCHHLRRHLRSRLVDLTEVGVRHRQILCLTIIPASVFLTLTAYLQWFLTEEANNERYSQDSQGGQRKWFRVSRLTTVATFSKLIRNFFLPVKIFFQQPPQLTH